MVLMPPNSTGAATVLAQTRGDVIRPGDYDGQEEVTRLADHARHGSLGSPERRTYPWGGLGLTQHQEGRQSLPTDEMEKDMEKDSKEVVMNDQKELEEEANAVEENEVEKY